jgi:hypothetical protein
MKSFFLSSLLFLFFSVTSGQNLIGLRESEIITYMKENRKDMHLNRVVNESFSYLKYSDNFESQTMLFFLNRDSICYSIRIICDEQAKKQRVSEFNSIYRKKSDDRWIDFRNGREYIVMLKNDEWSFVFTMEPVKR